MLRFNVVARSRRFRVLYSNVAAALPSKVIRLDATDDELQADSTFIKWCADRGVMAPRVELGHCELGGVRQRALFASADIVRYYFV
jgi:hypothetical protein